jgi:hypothetical protein
MRLHVRSFPWNFPKDACRVLQGLSSNDDFRLVIIQQDAVPLMLNCIREKSYNDDVQETGLKTLAVLGKLTSLADDF